MRQVKLKVGSATLAVSNEGFTFCDDDGPLGFRKLSLRVVAGGRARRVKYEAAEIVDGRIEATGRAGTSGLVCRTRLSPVETGETGRAVVVTHTLTNDGGDDVAIRSLTTGQYVPASTVQLGKLHTYDARYAHTDNVRIERFPYSHATYPYVRAIPAVPVELGVGEDQPFPGVYLTDCLYRWGVVIAAAEQEKTIQTWRIGLAAGGAASVLGVYEMRHELPQAGDYVLAPGESLTLDGTWCQLVRDTHPQGAFADYLDYIASRTPMRGAVSPLLNEPMYCGWNYGRFSEQWGDGLLKTARFIRERLEGMKLFFVDEGYMTATDRKADCRLARFYGDPNANIHPEKFPDGMRAFSDRIRELGLRPGIWWSPTVKPGTKLASDHPDWLLLDDRGEVLSLGGAHFLDLTVPAAVDWLDGVFRVMLREWNMDGVKVDFWSHMFEDRRGRLRGRGVTSLQTRRLMFEMMRKYLPPDGVIMSCIAVGMGDPFLGRWVDTYRNSLDIHMGTWEQQVHNCEWSLPMLAIPGRQGMLVNPDAIGVNLDCPENENLFRLTWGFITQGILEIDGFLEELPEPWVERLARLVRRCDRGYRCECLDERAFTGYPLPRALMVSYPPDSPTAAGGVRASVALLNWEDAPEMISVRRERLGGEQATRAVDFWTGAEEAFDGEFVTRRLEPRSAALYDIML